MKTLDCSFAFDDHDDGFKENLEVERNGPVADVVNIEGAAFFEGDVAATGNLSKAGEAGFNGEDKRAVAIVAQFVGEQSAGADERDVAFKNVEKLRQFVERSFADKMADFGDAGVIFNLVAIFAVFFGFAHFNEGLFGSEARIFGFHRTEFIAFKTAIILGKAFVGVNGGSFRVAKFDDEPDDSHRDGADNDADERDKDIESTFDDDIAAS